MDQSSPVSDIYTEPYRHSLDTGQPEASPERQLWRQHSWLNMHYQWVYLVAQFITTIPSRCHPRPLQSLQRLLFIMLPSDTEDSKCRTDQAESDHRIANSYKSITVVFANQSFASAVEKVVDHPLCPGRLESTPILSRQIIAGPFMQESRHS